MLNAFEFKHPDRMPAVYHPSSAGLYVHGQKLLDLFRQYPPDNSIQFDTLPQPPPGTVDRQGRYHELRRDEWGTTWEFLIFGIQGHPKYYPFADWRAAADYALPTIPALDSPAFAEDQKSLEDEQKNFLVFRGGVSLFEKLYVLRPFDEVLADLASGNPHLLAFLDRLTAYWRQVIGYQLALGADVIAFGDDWGMQHSQIISTKLFRQIFRPRYRKLMDPVKQAGRKIFFHSCGWLGEIFAELLDLGIDGLWPQINCFEGQNLAPACVERRIAIYLHPDRQRLVPLGTPGQIQTAIRNYAERYHKLGGGGIFYVEMENDAPFENVKALIEAIHRYR